MRATQNTLVDSMETYRSITRPVIYDSIIAILKYFKLDGAKKVIFNGEAEITKLIGSDFGDNQQDTLYTDSSFRNKVYAVATVEPSEFNAGYHNQRREVTEAVFWGDQSLDFEISPEFVGRKVTVELNSHFTSRQAAQQFVNRINYIRDQLLTDFTFDGSGHLPVNDGILELIRDVHQLAVNNKIRNDEWFPYFAEKSLRGFTVLSNLIGNQKTLAYPVKLRDHQIQFEEPNIRLPQKAEIFGQYEVGFSYSFFYNEFIGWNVRYPLHIHQDQIPEKWVIPIRPTYQESVPYHGAANPEYVNGVKLVTNERLTQAPFYYVLPAHDSWEKPFRDYISPVIQVRLRVDETVGEQLLCNIFEIPEFQWSENAKAYILRRKDYAFSHHDTPFLFEAYSDDLLIEPNQLRMDETGNVYITRDPTTTRLQHLIINIDYDRDNYSDNFWDDIRNNGGIILPDIYPHWDWGNIPDDWSDSAPAGLPVDTKIPFNNYQMELGLIVKNVKTYKD